MVSCPFANADIAVVVSASIDSEFVRCGFTGTSIARSLGELSPCCAALVSLLGVEIWTDFGTFFGVVFFLTFFARVAMPTVEKNAAAIDDLCGFCAVLRLEALTLFELSIEDRRGRKIPIAFC